MKFFPGKTPITEEVLRRASKAAASKDVDSALLELGELFPRLGELKPVEDRFGVGKPPVPAAVLTALVAGALNRAGRAENVEPLIRSVAEAYMPPRPRDGEGRAVSVITFLYPFLLVPLVEANLALGDPERALERLSDVQGAGWATRAAWFAEDTFLAEILGHAEIAARLERLPSDEWILDRKLEVRAARTMDFALERDVKFDTELLRAALVAGVAECVAAVVEEHLATRERTLRLCGYHLGFNCVLVLADVGRHDEAMHLARDIVRHGYGLAWRFNLEAAAKKPWTQAMRQNEALAGLAVTPEYQAWTEAKVRYIAPSDGDPIVLSHVAEGTWGGKKPCKCAFSRVRIEPGEPVVRIRRIHDPSRSAKIEVISTSAFDSGPMRAAREQFEEHRVPIGHLFPDPRRVRESWGNAQIAALAHDLAQDPHALDLDRAARLVAEADPPPPRFLWADPKARQGWSVPFPPRAQDRGYGDPVTIVWRLWRAGHGEELVRRLSELPEPLADKAMAMVGTVDDAELRRAAAEHFDVPGLAAMMELVFAPKLSLDAHARLADFGRDQARYRRAIVAAMRSYGLHLYNTGGPTADWYLDGLHHYGYAHGSQLLYFLIHSPGEDEVLAEMLSTKRLPRDTSQGGYGYYGDTKSIYYRAACLHLAWHAPGDLEPWTSGPMAEAMSRAYDRATKRLLASALR